MGEERGCCWVSFLSFLGDRDANGNVAFPKDSNSIPP